MGGSWTIGDPRGPDRFRRWGRRGMGTMVAFVIWIVAIALIYALVQSQAQSGALAGVVRVVALRTVVTAGQSALAEATHVVRHPPEGRPKVLDELLDGSDSGDVHIPLATRDLNQDLVTGGTLTIDPVRYQVVSRPPSEESTEPWQLDFTVRVQFSPHRTGAPPLSRQVRRRFMGRIHRVTATLGPRKGQVVYSSLHVHPDPLVEVVEP